MKKVDILTIGLDSPENTFTNPDSVTWLNVSVRGKNALAQSGATTMTEFCNMDPKSFSRIRGIGVITIQEIGRELLKRQRRPLWLETLSRKFEYDAPVLESEAEAILEKKEGWVRVSGGYVPQEYYFLEIFLADLERGGLSYRLYRCEGETGPIFIFRKGVKFHHPEE